MPSMFSGKIDPGRQQVVVERQTSSIDQVTSRVPQSSVLSPTLFLAYTNDISINIMSRPVWLFAYDTILYRVIQIQADTIIFNKTWNNLKSGRKNEKYHSMRGSVMSCYQKKKEKNNSDLHLLSMH